MGVPRRLDGSASVLFESGTNWTSPIYSCASATRAIVKSTEFGFNDSSSLDGLSIIRLEEKSYEDSAQHPLWAVESTEDQRFPQLRHLNPIWGIVNAEDPTIFNMSYLRAPHLWLSSDTGLASLEYVDYNLPAADFPGVLLATSYLKSVPKVGDYSGSTNLPLYNEWKNLSSTSEGAARIINLIWTDLAANELSVLGDGSLLIVYHIFPNGLISLKHLSQSTA